MITLIIKKKTVLGFIVVLISLLLIWQYVFSIYKSKSIDSSTNKALTDIVYNIYYNRSYAILMQDKELLASLYDREIKYGVWAYEHELKRMKYLNMWAEKQGVKFVGIDATPHIRSMSERNSGYRINLMVTTEYRYVYVDEPRTVNISRIGTYHSLDIVDKEDKWFITREWYTDPFADSLSVNNLDTDEIRNFISTQEKKNLDNLLERRKKAVLYADKYVGAAKDEESGLSYNNAYINYNHLGGDCANFASQILYEGGGFRKNYTWNYEREGSKAWVNAQSFKNYMLYSGRASKVAYGTYSQVYKASYSLKPGDIIAYEKSGKVKHISTVTGEDSKGYLLVNCHNTDRYRVPWDLGWSNKNIKFWLIHVHY